MLWMHDLAAPIGRLDSTSARPPGPTVSRASCSSTSPRAREAYAMLQETVIDGLSHRLSHHEVARARRPAGSCRSWTSTRSRLVALPGPGIRPGHLRQEQRLAGVASLRRNPSMPLDLSAPEDDGPETAAAELPPEVLERIEAIETKAASARRARRPARQDRDPARPAQRSGRSPRGPGAARDQGVPELLPQGLGRPGRSRAEGPDSRGHWGRPATAASGSWCPRPSCASFSATWSRSAR